MVKGPSDNVIRFPAAKVAKLGFRRVKRRRAGESRLEEEGQLNLFSTPAGSGPAGEVVHLPTGLGPFDEALLRDEAGDDAAAEWYRRAIDAEDGVADAFCNLGVIETRNDRREEAFRCFTEALKHDPRHLESHYNVGNLYFENGELRPARLHYELAAELDPDFPNVHFNLAVVDAMNGEVERAVEELETYLELANEGDRPKAVELLANLKQSLRRHK